MHVFGVHRQQQAVSRFCDVDVRAGFELHEILLTGVGHAVGGDVDALEVPLLAVLGDNVVGAQIFLGVIIERTGFLNDFFCLYGNTQVCGG